MLLYSACQQLASGSFLPWSLDRSAQIMDWYVDSKVLAIFFEAGIWDVKEE
jgi:hypothetical protein